MESWVVGPVLTAWDNVSHARVSLCLLMNISGKEICSQWLRYLTYLCHLNSLDVILTIRYPTTPPGRQAPTSLCVLSSQWLSLGNSLLLACVARLSSNLTGFSSSDSVCLTFHDPSETITHAVPCGLSSFSSSIGLWHSASTLFASVSPFLTFHRIRMQMCYKFAFLLGPIPFAVHSQCLLVCVPDAYSL